MNDLVLIGTVVKAHGIRGEVVVSPESDVEGRFQIGSVVLVDGKTVTVKSSRPHQGRLLVGFSHVPDRTAAEGLRGAKVEGERADVADEDNFYAHELVGLDVLGPDGEDLGEVVEIVLMPSAAGYDLLEVLREDGRRWFLPAHDELVEVVEAEDGSLLLQLVELPEGLLDPDAADEVPRERADEEATD